MTGTRHPFRPLTVLDWTPCRRGDPGATWTGARWACPPLGLAVVVIAAAGVAIRDGIRTDTRPPWRPWWQRPNGRRPAPAGGVTVFAGDHNGVTVGGLR